MSNFTFNAITNAQDIKKAAGQIEVNDNNSVFLSAYWFSHSIDDQNISYTATDEQSIVQHALHLKTHNKFGIKIAEMASEPFGQYSDAINNSDQALDGFFGQALDHLKSTGVDALHLRNVRADAHIFEYCQKHGMIIEQKQAPRIDLTAFADYPTYQKSMGKNIPRVYRKLMREFDTKTEVFVDEQITRELAEEVIALKLSQLDHHGQTSRVFADSKFTDQMVDMFSTPSPDFKTVIGTVRCDGELAAASISHAKGDTYYGYIIAMDVKFTRHSPGNAQVLSNVEWSLANGITKFDFLSPADDYKFKWTKKQSSDVYDILIPMSGKGKFYGKAYLKNLRPKLKSAYLWVKNSSPYKTLKK